MAQLIVFGEHAPVVDLNSQIFLQVRDRRQRDGLSPVGVIGGRSRGRLLFYALLADLQL